MKTRTVGELRESARRVLPGLDLAQIYLVESSLKTHNRNQIPPFHVESGIHVQGRQSGDAVEVWARYTTSVFTDRDDETRIPVWTVDLQCVAVYAADANSDAEEPSTHSTEDLEAFALLVGAPALHPYAREWTQTLSSHSQYPALTLGVLQSIAELPEDETVDLVEDQTLGDLPD